MLVGPLPPPFGGMANQTRQLARLLSQEGVRVGVVRSNAPYRPAWIGRFRGIRAVFRLLPYLLRLWRGAGECDVVHVMANSGWSWHLFAAPAIWVAALRRIPVVVNYRGGEAAVFLNESESLVKWSLRWVDEVVVPSGYLRDIFEAHGIETKIIPNVVDLSLFEGEERDRASDTPHLIVCRNLEPIYDNATALRAFSEIQKKHPKARLTIAGEGPQRHELEQLAVDLGLEDKVCFAGRLDVKSIVELYRSADLMLNASRVDNMPNALLEALSMGVPIVTTDAGGIPYIVEDGKTALIVPVGDWEAMARQAERLLHDAVLYRALSSGGLEAVTRYRWASVGPRWLTCYRSLVAS